MAESDVSGQRLQETSDECYGLVIWPTVLPSAFFLERRAKVIEPSNWRLDTAGLRCMHHFAFSLASPC
jgi:hypothetical protein